MNPTLFPSDKVFSVTEINSVLKDMIEGTFPSVTIEGEISNYRPNSSGHLYFTLKDSSSQIGAVMFRSNACSLSFPPKDGMKVSCTGRLSVYLPRGNYQIVVTRMEVAGEGDILRLLEERKRRLAAEGLFDEARKRRIPPFPRTVGIVTSPTGAALRDILQITKRRNPGVSVVILPAVVQGEEAAATIVRQIRTANAFRLCDVLIVGRGGGSLEDLLPFSDEAVIRAVAASEIPVISAVGHEIDWALSDYAADRRAPTPSAAAELAVPQKAEIVRTLRAYSEQLCAAVTARTEKVRLMVRQFNPENLELKFRTIEQPLLLRFDNAKEAAFQNILRRLADARQTVENRAAVLESLSPVKILERGYSVVRDRATGAIIRAAGQTAPGAEIEVIPASGRYTARVESQAE